MSEENGNGAAENEEPEEALVEPTAEAPGQTPGQTTATEGAEGESPEGANDIAILQAEIAALRERALRALAEAENTRKRAEREKDETRQFAISRFARDLLSVSDNLNRALAACPPEARESADDALKAVIDGIEATERELQSVLSQHGVKAIEASGTKFDPNLHQAIAEVPSEGKPKGTVMTVVQGGYMIGERLLRAAMVTVAKGDAAAQSESEKARETGPEA
jgi:molecular chaperone GrpE